MPFSGGTYTNVSGATTAVAGNVVQSATWDNIHTDYATALTMLMSQLLSMVTNRNALYMNGGFEIWQRGAGANASISVAATTTAYTADRWYLTTGANEASTVATQVGLVSGSFLAARIQKTAAQTGTALMTFGYPLDTDEILRLRGSKVSLTCLVKAGANWSPANGTLTVALYVGTGAVAKRGGGFTSETTVLSVATNLTPGGAVVTITGNSSAVLPTTAAQAELQFTWTPVGTAGANDDITIDDVQIEPQLSASTWTPTNYDRLPFAEMLQYCKRHFWKTFLYGTAPGQALGVNVGELAGIAGVIAGGAEKVNGRHPVSMRSSPTLTTYNPSAANAQVRDGTAGADCSATAVQSNSAEDFRLTASGNAATVVGNLLIVHMIADAGI